MRIYHAKTESQLKQFSATDFLCRVNKIKLILKESGLEGLCLVAGSDGCNNQVTNMLLNYLFSGTFGNRFNY